MPTSLPCRMPWVGSWFSQKSLQQLLVRDLRRVEDDQHRLGVAGAAAADLLVGRVRRVAAGVADRGRVARPAPARTRARRPRSSPVRTRRSRCPRGTAAAAACRAPRGGRGRPFARRVRPGRRGAPPSRSCRGRGTCAKRSESVQPRGPFQRRGYRGRADASRRRRPGHQRHPPARRRRRRRPVERSSATSSSPASARTSTGAAGCCRSHRPRAQLPGRLPAPDRGARRGADARRRTSACATPRTARPSWARSSGATASPPASSDGCRGGRAVLPRRTLGRDVDDGTLVVDIGGGSTELRHGGRRPRQPRPRLRPHDRAVPASDPPTRATSCAPRRARPRATVPPRSPTTARLGVAGDRHDPRRARSGPRGVRARSVHGHASPRPRREPPDGLPRCRSRSAARAGPRARAGASDRRGRDRPARAARVVRPGRDRGQRA